MSKFYEIKNLQKSHKNDEMSSANNSMINLGQVPFLDISKNMLEARNNSNSMNVSSSSFTKLNKVNKKIDLNIQSNNEDNLKVEQENIEEDTKLNLINQNQKIFMTDYKMNNFDNKDLYIFQDLIIPGGKNAKLCIISEPFDKNVRVSEIADHFKFYEPTPTIVLIGANTKRK